MVSQDPPANKYKISREAERLEMYVCKSRKSPLSNSTAIFDSKDHPKEDKEMRRFHPRRVKAQQDRS
tara:strand:- start:781 stop:981 length:201 start_codon:yes stop_codon:yes gene_type:complete